ncbi:MAG TPA: NUDIX domain-containing protein [Acidimicrobiales bacterium]
MPVAIPEKRDVVVTGILMRDSKVLLCHRTSSRLWYPNVWDFPGGHVDEGETDTIALKRELGEELAIEILETQDFPVARLSSNDFAMTIWLVTEWSGSPINAQSEEHDEIGWFTEQATLGLDLADKTYHSLIAKVFEQRATTERP